MIEFEKMPPSLDDFASLLDKTLQQLNSDYEAKRYKEISLQPLEIRVAREGTFYEWLRRKGKLGGQHKIPRLSNDRTFIEELGMHQVGTEAVSERKRKTPSDTRRKRAAGKWSFQEFFLRGPGFSVRVRWRQEEHRLHLRIRQRRR